MRKNKSINDAYACMFAPGSIFHGWRPDSKKPFSSEVEREPSAVLFAASEPRARCVVADCPLGSQKG